MFHLNPETVDHDEILMCVEEIEKRQLERVRDILWWRVEEKVKVILLRHKTEFPFVEKVKPEQLSVYSDLTAADGMRVIRLHHTLSTFRTVQDSEKDWSEPMAVIDDFKECAFDIFASLVFDRHGRLIALHADKPQLNDLH